MKIIVTLIPTTLDKNSLLSLQLQIKIYFYSVFVLSQKPKKKKNQTSANWWSGNFMFFVYSESLSTSNRCQIQQNFIKKFFACFSCLYYSFMLISVSTMHNYYAQLFCPSIHVRYFSLHYCFISVEIHQILQTGQSKSKSEYSI